MSLTFKFQKKSLIKNYINPNASQLHLIIKTHKTDHPIYPLINFKIAPFYNLTKYLDLYMKQNSIITADYCIKNIYDFIEEIKKVNIIQKNKIIFLSIKKCIYFYFKT